MISDFDQLSEKIAQLAAMTQALRRENAELRVRNASLVADNADLSGRIQQAQQRVTALIDRLPASQPEGGAT